MRDRLWFFTSGRLRDESQGRTLIGTHVPYEFTEEQRRYEVKGTYSSRRTPFPGELQPPRSLADQLQLQSEPPWTCAASGRGDCRSSSMP